MPEIEISDAEFESLTSLANDADLAAGQVVDRLIRAFLAGHSNPAIPMPCTSAPAPMPRTPRPKGLVVITSGPLTNHRYRAPRGARSAVITAADPGASPAGSGGDFRTLTDCNLPLRTLR